MSSFKHMRKHGAILLLLVLVSSGIAHTFTKFITRKAQRFCSLGIVKMNDKDFVGAKDDFNKAIKISPEYADGWQWLGLSYLELKEYELAGMAFRNVTRLKPDYAYAHTLVGITLHEREMYEKAVIELYQGLDMNDEYGEEDFFGNYYLGLYNFMAAEDSLKAIFHFEAALGPEYVERKHHKLAKQIIKNRDPTYQRQRKAFHVKTLHWLIGNAYGELKKKNMSRIHFRIAYDLGLKDAIQELKHLDDTLLKQCNGYKSKASKNVSKHHKKIKTALFDAMTYTKSHKSEKASKALHEILMLEPWFPVARYNLAIVEADRGYYHEAVVQMKCYLRIKPKANNRQEALEKITAWKAKLPK
ncbi:hypothetical protein ACFL6Y_09745 [Elusimicrobiota bacterium]